jgi:isoquinoline 1-oxidoreductase subunit beta
VRRDEFLTASLAAGGAVVFGFRAGARAAAAFAPNAWIELRPDGRITITVPMSELGQGVATALPMLAADELDADWSRVVVRSAPADKSRYGDQGIGGSRSLRTKTAKFREAGASVREMLVAAAAGTWNVPPSQCRTSAANVYHDASGRVASYASLIEAVALQTPPPKPVLKKREAFTLIGKPMGLREAGIKSTGQAVYALDVRLRGMLYASIERAPRPGARIAGYDQNAARTVAGVQHVIALDRPPVRDAYPFWPGVAVLADSSWAALAGRKLLRLRWSGGDHANASSATIRADLLAGLSGEAPAAVDRGNVDEAFRAVTPLEAVYETTLQAHCTMEPLNATADVRSYRCEVWAPTQSPADVQDGAAEITGLPLGSITVHQVLAGGGFGRSSDSDHALEAITLSKFVHRPVKVVWTREDDIRHDTFRPPHASGLRAAIGSDGTLLALSHRHAGPSIGIQRGYQKPDEADREALEGLLDNVHYALPAYRVEFKNVDTVPVHLGWWRAVSVAQNVFAAESFVDEIAHAAGKDPYLFRRELLAADPIALAVLDAVAKRAEWTSSPRPGVGRGIAFGAYGGTITAQVAEVRREARGKIVVGRMTCAMDCGMIVNPLTVQAQVQGGIVWGIGAALFHEITVEKGAVVQRNFDDYPMVRMADMPEIDVVLLDSAREPSGAGEPPVVAVAPAIANAVFDLTGERLRRLPLKLRSHA